MLEENGYGWLWKFVWLEIDYVRDEVLRVSYSQMSIAVELWLEKNAYDWLWDWLDHSLVEWVIGDWFWGYVIEIKGLWGSRDIKRMVMIGCGIYDWKRALWVWWLEEKWLLMQSFYVTWFE